MMVDNSGVVDGEDDETVVVDRAARTASADEIDGTVVIDRPGRRSRARPAEVDDEEDRTIVVDRQEEDRTVVVDRAGRESDQTVALDRGRRGKRVRAGFTEPTPESVIKLLPSRRSLRAAPVEPGFGREPVEAVGANVVETYLPREIAPAPILDPTLPRGDEALRAEAPSMPSVARHSRKAGILALLIFAGACVVSVIGLVAVIAWFVGS